MIRMIFGFNFCDDGSLKLSKNGSFKLHNIVLDFDSALEQIMGEFMKQKWTRCGLVLGRQMDALRNYYEYMQKSKISFGERNKPRYTK